VWKRAGGRRRTRRATASGTAFWAEAMAARIERLVWPSGTTRVEAEARRANRDKGEPDDGEEESDAPPEGKDFGLKLGTVEGEYLGRDDGPRAAPNPTDGRGAWNTEVMEQIRVALPADEVAHPVVVGTAAGGGRHGAW
jgi:hypothetical protein